MTLSPPRGTQYSTWDGNHPYSGQCYGQGNNPWAASIALGPSTEYWGMTMIRYSTWLFHFDCCPANLCPMQLILIYIAMLLALVLIISSSITIDVRAPHRTAGTSHAIWSDDTVLPTHQLPPSHLPKSLRADIPSALPPELHPCPSRLGDDQTAAKICPDAWNKVFISAEGSNISPHSHTCHTLPVSVMVKEEVSLPTNQLWILIHYRVTPYILEFQLW